MSKTKIPARLRESVLQRDGLKCLWCGRSVVDGVKLHVDHVLPESFGGSTTYENLGTLCDKCNLGKSNDYCGNYLLSTLLNVKNFEGRIKHIDTGMRYDETGRHYDGTFFEFKISFFIDNDNHFDIMDIRSQYLVSDFLKLENEDNSRIKIAKKKEEALLAFKNKLRDYLCENKGYLKIFDDRLVFTEMK